VLIDINVMKICGAAESALS